MGAGPSSWATASQPTKPQVTGLASARPPSTTTRRSPQPPTLRSVSSPPTPHGCSRSSTDAPAQHRGGPEGEGLRPGIHRTRQSLAPGLRPARIAPQAWPEAKLSDKSVLARNGTLGPPSSPVVRGRGPQPLDVHENRGCSYRTSVIADVDMVISGGTAEQPEEGPRRRIDEAQHCDQREASRCAVPRRARHPPRSNHTVKHAHRLPRKETGDILSDLPVE